MTPYDKILREYLAPSLADEVAIRLIDEIPRMLAAVISPSQTTTTTTTTPAKKPAGKRSSASVAATLRHARRRQAEGKMRPGDQEVIAKAEAVEAKAAAKVAAREAKAVAKAAAKAAANKEETPKRERARVVAASRNGAPQLVSSDLPI